ncbi:unnamed protein product [Prorocentrum cordatum]|uniref:Tyrosine-protein kinase ephrin type A/B receptor-like domain-containing protein n=1 Tax=Prorocentrum cordatum TaxID=2364126 RepID=A0ABN9YCK4_9DINO|nr:unnamed protein product [Polarella glacialis]
MASLGAFFAGMGIFLLTPFLVHRRRLQRLLREDLPEVQRTSGRVVDRYYRESERNAQKNQTHYIEVLFEANHEPSRVDYAVSSPDFHIGSEVTVAFDVSSPRQISTVVENVERELGDLTIIIRIAICIASGFFAFGILVAVSLGGSLNGCFAGVLLFASFVLMAGLTFAALGQCVVTCLQRLLNMLMSLNDLGGSGKHRYDSDRRGDQDSERLALLLNDPAGGVPGAPVPVPRPRVTPAGGAGGGRRPGVGDRVKLAPGAAVPDGPLGPGRSGVVVDDKPFQEQPFQVDFNGQVFWYGEAEIVPQSCATSGVGMSCRRVLACCCGVYCCCMVILLVSSAVAMVGQQAEYVPTLAALGACSAGSHLEYDHVSGVSSCIPCPSGTQSEEAATSLGDRGCWMCPAGTAAPNESTVLCEDCSPGRFARALGQTSCEECPAGSPASDPGQSSCGEVGAGSTSVSPE